MINNKIAVLFSIFMMLITAASVYSQQGIPETESLKGLGGIGVMIDDIDPVAVKDGLDADQLKSSVTEALRNGGIKILDPTEMKSTSGQPRIAVYINTIKHSGGVYSFTVSVSLDQIVLLERNQQIKEIVPTWSVLGTGASLPEDLNEDINVYVKQLVGQFVKDYKQVNK